MNRLKLLWAACLCLATANTLQAQDSAFGFGGSATGGGNATPTLITSVDGLEDALKASGSKVIIITQDLTFTTHLSVLATNKTLLALPGVTLTSAQQNKDNSGILYFKNGSKNLILRNLTFVGPGAYDCNGWDLLCFDGVTNAWVDHCDFSDGCDGNFDNKGNTDNITVSWCRFHYDKTPKSGGETDDHRFSNLIGSSSSDAPSDGTYSMTWAYCWWDEGCVERMTRCRNAYLHFLNCYWNSSVANYYIGPQNASAYIEGCAFQGMNSNKIFYENYGGTNYCNFVNSYGSSGLPSNSGSVSAPSYNYTALAYTEAVTQITDATCGAGATLTVTTNGSVSSSCNSATPTIAVSGTLSQTVTSGNAITNIIFTAGGTATDISVSNLPAGLSQNKSGLVLTISGTPTATGTYTVTATDGTNDVTQSGTITVSSNSGNSGCTSYLYFVSEDDATTNGVINTDIFSSLPAGSGSVTCSFSFDGADYTATKRSSNKTSSITFSVSSGTTATLFVVHNQSSRQYSLSNGSTPPDIVTETGAYSQTFTNLTAGDYTLSNTENIGLIFIGLKVCSNVTTDKTETVGNAVRLMGNTLQNPQNIRIQIFNITGQLVCTAQTDVDTSHFEKGIYLVRTENGKTVKIMKY